MNPIELHDLRVAPGHTNGRPASTTTEIFKEFGFTTEHVCEVARGVLTGNISGVISPAPDHVAPGDPA